MTDYDMIQPILSQTPILELSDGSSPKIKSNRNHFINRNIQNIKVYQQRVASISPKDERRSKTPWKRLNFDKQSDLEKVWSPNGNRHPNIPNQNVQNICENNPQTAIPKITKTLMNHKKTVSADMTES